MNIALAAFRGPFFVSTLLRSLRLLAEQHYWINDRRYSVKHSMQGPFNLYAYRLSTRLGPAPPSRVPVCITNLLPINNLAIFATWRTFLEPHQWLLGSNGKPMEERARDLSPPPLGVCAAEGFSKKALLDRFLVRRRSQEPCYPPCIVMDDASLQLEKIAPHIET
jgi:hypothetical protein